MEFSWTHMWQTMSPLAKAVAYVLVIMGLLSVSVFIERCFILFRHRRSSREFIKKAEPILNNPNYEASLKLTKEFPVSYAAKVVERGLKSYLSSNNNKKISQKLGRYLEVLSQEMRRGLGLLSTVGSVAPFVGLLGTVIGIIAAFQGIAQTGSGGLAAVSAGIAEALVETALGLFVAIPAVMAFHFLSGQFDKEEVLLRNMAGELLDKLGEKDAKELA